MVRKRYFHAPLYSMPPWGRTPSRFPSHIRHSKPRMVELPDGEKFLRYVQPLWHTTRTRGWTDEQTDGRTPHHGKSPLLRHAGNETEHTGIRVIFQWARHIDNSGRTSVTTRKLEKQAHSITHEFFDGIVSETKLHGRLNISVWYLHAKLAIKWYSWRRTIWNGI